MAFALVGGAASPPCCARPRGGRAARSPRGRARRSRDHGARRRCARRLARLAGLAGVGDPLLRASSSGRCCCSAPPGSRAPGGSGSSASRCSSRFWFDPRDRARSTTRATPTPRPPRRATASSPGDLVVATHPEQVPVDALLPAATGLRWATRMGSVQRPDGLGLARRAGPPARRQADGHRGRARARAAARASSSCSSSPIMRTARWGAPWTSSVRKRAIAVGARARPRPAPVARRSPRPCFGARRLPQGRAGVLYERGAVKNG